MTWKDYQEEAAEHFRSLGLNAVTDATVQGIRTSHDVDVLVTSKHAGFEVRWIVECKQWAERVSKLHVLALREIVSDLGADRGILLSESGFQSGAIEAANLTNVKVTSLAEARASSEHEINAMRLRDLYDRMEWCKLTYWDMSKSRRIEFGLRPDLFETGYSGAVVLGSLEELLRKSLRGRFPFETEDVYSLSLDYVPRSVNSPTDAIQTIEPMLAELEAKIKRAVQA